MLNSKPLNNLVFLDIETVPQHKSFFDMSKTMQGLFLKRFKRDSEKLTGVEMDEFNPDALNTPELAPEVEILYQTKAPLQTEFLKICCISIGFFKTKLPVDILTKPDPSLELEFITKSFSSEDEKALLEKYREASDSILNKGFNHSYHLVAHNGLNFDFPVIAKRMLLNGMECPPFFDISGKKPWDIAHLLCTKEAWRFGVYDANVSLPLLCEVFGIPTSKDDIDGSQVRNVYYEDKDVARIATYCEKDVLATATLYLRMKLISNKIIHTKS